MRKSISILAIVLCLPILGTAYAASPRVGADGSSLVVDSRESRKAASGDTLYELLGQEVQVFIFNNKTRVWPQVRVWPQASWRLSPMPWRGCTNPQLEALINKYATAYGVDPTLVRAVMRHESGFNPGAVSPKGAQGLMQLMPGTADLMGVSNPFDPEQNIAGGVGYLRRCLDRFGHNVPLAVAAYNAGPESVARYGTIPPYAETQVFVNNVMGSYVGKYPLGKTPGEPLKSQATQGKGPKSPPKLSGQMAKPEDGPGNPPKRASRPKPKIIEVRSAKAKEPRVTSKVIKGVTVETTRTPHLE